MQPQNEKTKGNYLKTASLRFSLFLITYLIAVISIFGVGQFLYAFLFPMGLGLVIFGGILYNRSSYDSSPMAWIIIGYSIYLILSLVGSLAKNRYAFIVIYIIFTLLLITNVVSCVKIGSGLN